MSEPFIGQIVMFGGTFAPRSWAFCNGQLLPISQNTALFSILGTTYGGDGRTTFALPDLRGRAPVHSGGGSAGPGLTPRPLGARGGQEAVTLNVTQIPQHNHGVGAQMRAESRPGSGTDPTGNMLAAGTGIYRANAAAEDVNMDAAMINVTQSDVGGSQAHDNMPPFLAVNYIIALFGIYPSRS